MSALRERWPLVVAAAIAIATVVGYAGIIRGQDTSSLSDPAPLFVIAYLTLLAAAAAVGATSAGRSASAGASAATGGLLTMGVLAIFSIGLPLLIAAGMSGWGLGRSHRTNPGTAWIDVAIAVATGAVGLILLVLP